MTRQTPDTADGRTDGRYLTSNTSVTARGAAQRQKSSTPLHQRVVEAQGSSQRWVEGDGGQVVCADGEEDDGIRAVMT